MIRFLLGLLLIQLNVAAFGAMLAWGTETYNAARWRYEAIVNAHERDEAQRRHAILIKQIKKEGLWGRLGMSGQTWLQ